MRGLRRGALLILALSAVFLVATGAGFSLARFNAGSASGANAITAGILAFYVAEQHARRLRHATYPSVARLR